MKIVDLPDGEPVPGPGFYRCSMAHYHSQAICPGPSISSSGLRTIASGSPWHFWATSELNPDRYEERKETEALTIGKAAHAMILGDEAFAEEFVFLPDDPPRRPTVQQIKAYDEGRASVAGAESVEFWRQFEEAAAGRTLVSQEHLVTIRRVAEALRRCPEAVLALTGGLTEISMIWQDHRTGVWLKSRPDVIPDNGYDFGDLKLFAPRRSNIKMAAQIAVSDYRYDMQMALATMAADALAGRRADNCVLIMAQRTIPYTVTPIRLTEDALGWGRVWTRKAIDTFAACLESGHWPQPVEGILDYTTPASLASLSEDMQMAGELPMEA
jgi:hypothetical protein